MDPTGNTPIRELFGEINGSVYWRPAQAATPHKTIDVVKMPDGKFTTVDNTRVLAAKNAGIDVQVTVHAASDPIPADVAVRFTSKNGQVPTTWGEAVTNRINNQNSAYRTTNPNGSYITGWDGN